VQLSGRVALVTGASSGIGRALAGALAKRGIRVKATGRDRAALDALTESVGADVLAADLTEEGGVDRVAAWAGPVDILVNNAGVGWTGPFDAMAAAAIEELTTVNLVAPILLTRALVGPMIERGEGHIVNVSSIAGHVGVGNEAVYSATKAALVAFTDSLRYELTGTGVGLTLVSPGVVETPFFERAGRRYTRSFPRMISADRVASAIVRAIERDASDVFVPRWMAVPARIRGAWPRLYRRLASRFG
jgi:short-subunit dehydrogenase